ncbi:hypothetical protein I546_5221 [Mycobacterium kansasii 732]|nr:hypothetical protein I546_5221 [Mycobacterium kansasii 732]
MVDGCVPSPGASRRLLAAGYRVGSFAQLSRAFPSRACPRFGQGDGLRCLGGR